MHYGLIYIIGDAIRIFLFNYYRFYGKKNTFEGEKNLIII